MFMDISSEMVQSLLPVFLVAGLGASPALVGLIEGVAEATASITTGKAPRRSESRSSAALSRPKFAERQTIRRGR
jgi:hypothetical protein